MEQGPDFKQNEDDGRRILADNILRKPEASIGETPKVQNGSFEHTKALGEVLSSSRGKGVLDGFIDGLEDLDTRTTPDYLKR